ncbi:inactive glucose-1-phosphate adenylyltransferase small subunit 2, chloroplastic isoform X1 [Primulina tabacum]|uniref:inactive glucose-1-phosphate adenylyltransferase small subunit 2, chloroplastic isoform X1 n=1 Tax=Primulina tabacum TaxID=48773 RepID=UPI003F5A4EAE
MSVSGSMNPRIGVKDLCYQPAGVQPCLTKSFSSIFYTKNLQATGSPTYLLPPANKSVAAIVFGDGSSHSKLYPLTKRRSEGAIPIAGNYRLIDAVVSNCINSNISKIYAITQFNSTSLNSHLSRAYSGTNLIKEGFVEVIAAYQSPEDKGWFQGTADSIRRCLWMLEEYPVLEYLVIPGYHLYKMDYQKLIDVHRSSKADITVSVLSKRRNEDLGIGIFELDAKNQVIKFKEDQELKASKSISVEDSKELDNIAKRNFPSMGIYVINRNTMIKLLREYFPSANDLKSEVIRGAVSLGLKVQAYQFDGYWEDMRSIEAYYRVNMELTRRTNKAFNSFYDRDTPLYTLPRCLPPTLINDAVIADSVIADGCILSVRMKRKINHPVSRNSSFCFSHMHFMFPTMLLVFETKQRCKIKGTVVGVMTRVADEAVIEDSIIMGADTYSHQSYPGIQVGIGEGSLVRKAIVDKNARIGKNVMIINKDNVQEANKEAEGYIITGGIIVITRSAAIPDGSVI